MKIPTAVETRNVFQRFQRSTWRLAPGAADQPADVRQASQAVAVEQRLKFVRVRAGRLAGLHPWQAEVRERTGAAVVAVEREQTVFVNFDPAFRVRPDDLVFVCGTLGSLSRYAREFQTALEDSRAA